MGRAGGLREDFHQKPEAARSVGRAGGLTEDFFNPLDPIDFHPGCGISP